MILTIEAFEKRLRENGLSEEEIQRAIRHIKEDFINKDAKTTTDKSSAINN